MSNTSINQLEPLLNTFNFDTNHPTNVRLVGVLKFAYLQRSRIRIQQIIDFFQIYLDETQFNFTLYLMLFDCLK